MQHAHIVPVDLMDISTTTNQCHLLLLHWAKQSDEYVKFYSNNNQYKILDNSFYELKVVPTAEEILEWADKLKVQEVVAPDKMFDLQETKKKVEEFMEFVPTKYKVQAVLVGNNEQELNECLKFYIDIGVDVIAFARRGYHFPSRGDSLNSLSLNRMVNLERVHAQISAADKEIHFLGANTINDFLVDGVRSIDSKFITKRALQKNKIELDTPVDEEHKKWFSYLALKLNRNIEEWKTWG